MESFAGSRSSIHPCDRPTSAGGSDFPSSRRHRRRANRRRHATVFIPGRSLPSSLTQSDSFLHDRLRTLTHRCHPPRWVRKERPTKSSSARSERTRPRSQVEIALHALTATSTAHLNASRSVWKLWPSGACSQSTHGRGSRLRHTATRRTRDLRRTLPRTLSPIAEIFDNPHCFNPRRIHTPRDAFDLFR